MSVLVTFSLLSSGHAAPVVKVALTGLELLDETLGPAESRCSLGFLAGGSPLKVTRTAGPDGESKLTTGDEVVSINQHPTRNAQDARDVMRTLSAGDRVELRIVRHNETKRIRARCGDAQDVLKARADVLTSATSEQWLACIRATYREELLWGGSNSQSAGLRLWCEQSKQRTRPATTTIGLSAMSAQLLHDYAAQLLVELPFLAAKKEDLLEQVSYEAGRIKRGGHAALAQSLEEKISYYVSR
ncbi:MAG: PDZ domain-containing protein [Pseudomonadota bacterium]